MEAFTQAPCGDLFESSMVPRMGRYTDTMRDLGAIEETEVHRREVELPDFLQRSV